MFFEIKTDTGLSVRLRRDYDLTLLDRDELQMELAAYGEVEYAEPSEPSAWAYYRNYWVPRLAAAQEIRAVALDMVLA